MRVVTASQSFVADEILDVFGGLVWIDTGGKVAVSLMLKFQWGDGARAGQRCQTRTGWPMAGALGMTGVGQKLLLVEVHLPLDFVLSVVASTG